MPSEIKSDKSKIKIYNSLTRTKEEFIPLKEGQVGMYVCGPTVYDEPHIGHVRSAYVFDVIRRYLIYRGYKVRFVRNVTDVDDKIIDKARREFPDQDLNTAVCGISSRYLSSYHEAMKAFGILEPDFEPKATEYIGKMVAFIQKLIELGAAYESAGDVYFDIHKAPGYGKLSNQKLSDMEAGARVFSGEKKKNPLDFSLWKSAKENEPSWESPWGRGRPGWHIECSAMSSDILGGSFDIHGGGLDLIFPHHENEVAQSEGAGNKFAKYWIHHGLLTINGQKMAKSLGNFITVKDFMGKHKNSDLAKLLFLGAHYSHPVDYNEEKIEETKSQKERMVRLLEKLSRVKGQGTGDKGQEKNINKEIEGLKNKFTEVMDDDFNMPQGLAVIFELINVTNKNIDNPGFASSAKRLLLELSGVFGLEPEKKAGFKDLPSSVMVLLKKRDDARGQGNFKEADNIRKALDQQGIILEDTKDGTVWRRKT